MEQFIEPVEGQNDGQETAACRFRIALEALEGRKTISTLSSEHDIHPNLIRTSK